MPTEGYANDLSNAGIARSFQEKGWEIRYRGGNSMCSTPSELEMIVADAPNTADASGSPNTRPRYSIAAWPAANHPGDEPHPPVFDLYDAARDVEVRVDHVPTPEQAAHLLEGRSAEKSPTEFSDGV